MERKGKGKIRQSHLKGAIGQAVSVWFMSEGLVGGHVGKEALGMKTLRGIRC